MSKVIIGIHGLGNKPSKDVIEKWWTLSMKEGLKLIGRRQNIPKFEIVYWADLFYETPLDERIGDKEDPRYLDEPYRVAPLSLRQNSSKVKLKVLDFIGIKLKNIFLTSDFSLKYTEIADTIVEKFFHELSAYFKSVEQDIENTDIDVRSKITKRVVDTIRKYEGDDILIVSHSMGSIIAFDVLTFIIPNAQIKTLVTIGSPLCMPNVLGKIAHIHRKKGVEKVVMKTPPPVIKSWFNFFDPDDNVAFNYKLGKDFRENDFGVTPIDFMVFNNYVINSERNPHKSYGYLRAPELANVVAEFLESKQTLRQMAIGFLFRISRHLQKVKKFIAGSKE